MRIAVSIKQVPTREWQPRIDDTGRAVREDDAGFEMNEPDAYALEEALRLREQHGGDVIACTAGPARAAQVLREALARGADRALHVEDDRFRSVGGAGGLAVAAVLADAIGPEAPDLVLTGLQSDDDGGAQVGAMMAERLGIPHATIVMEVQIHGAHARVKRELEGGWFQWIEMPLPAVLTIQSGINRLRYATLKGIMAAKKKELRRIVPAAVLPSTTRLVALAAPARTRRTEMLAGGPQDAARALVRKLREDARVLE